MGKFCQHRCRFGGEGFSALPYQVALESLLNSWSASSATLTKAACLQDPTSSAAKLVLTLFSAVFDVLTKYPQTDNILLPNFASLIRHCLTASCNAANPTGADAAGYMG